jgi:hypothetical protein
MKNPSHSGENRPAIFLQQAVCQSVIHLKFQHIFILSVARNKQMLTFYPWHVSVCQIPVQPPRSAAPRALNLFAN